MARDAPEMGIIVNANAGRVRRRYLADDRFWEQHLPPHAVRITRSTEDLRAAVASLAAQDIGVVACLGGDGTLHQLVNALIRHHRDGRLPIVLPLAGGTLNGVARALGTGRAAESVLRESATIIARGTARIRTQPLLLIKDTCNGEQRVGFTFAAGLPARAVRHYVAHRRPGLLAAATTSLLPVTAALLGGDFYRPVTLGLTVDDAPWSGDTHTFVAGVLTEPFLWFRPFGPDVCAEGRFHIAAASMRPMEVAPRLWSIFRGRCRHPGLRTASASVASLSWSEGFAIDGEVVSQDRHSDIRLSLGPAIRVLT